MEPDTPGQTRTICSVGKGDLREAFSNEGREYENDNDENDDA
jgi:hypothetical protein